MFLRLILCLLLQVALAQLSQWSTISWMNQAGQSKTADIVKAVGSPNMNNGAIDCRNQNPCDITLNITHMLTMTLYDYYPNLNTRSGGYRGVDGYAINFTASGAFEFRYTSANGIPNRDISTFLWPIIADAHLEENSAVERRTVIAVNNQMPGPTIILVKGQTVNAKVINNLASESISVHWHGQHVLEYPWMDGVAHVTQCPIDPNTEFTYTFKPDQVGTHWYHAHSGALRTDGLFGALIITSDDEFEETNIANIIDRPDEHTLTLIDWQHESSIELFSVIQSGSRFKSPVDPDMTYKNPPIYDGSDSAPYPFISGLINGQGWEFSPIVSESCFHSPSPLTFFNVELNNVYRFRLVGAQSAYAFRFSIEGHKLRLLATDGILVRTNPEEVDYIIIHSGERYDFLLNTTGQSVSTYWMVAETLEINLTNPDIGYNCREGRRAHAVLQYAGAVVNNWPLPIDYDPTTRCTLSTCHAANCPFKEFPSKYNINCVNVASFEQVETEDSLRVTETAAFLNFGFGGDVTVAGSSINGRHFLFPPRPLLTQFGDLEESFWPENKCMASDDVVDKDRGRRCVQYLKVSHNMVVEIVLMNFLRSTQRVSAGQGHPIHLHGHHFQIMHICYVNCTNVTGTEENPGIECGNDFCDSGVKWANNGMHYRNTMFSTRKDTVIVPVGGYVVIRFKADNPGWWFLHCHIEPHQLEGMAMVIQEGQVSIPGEIPKCAQTSPDGSPPKQVASFLLLITMFVVWCVL